MDELFSLLLNRDDALLSSAHRKNDVEVLDQGVQQQIDSLVLDAENLKKLELALSSADPDQVYAATYVLLRLQDQKATDLIIQTLLQMDCPRRLDALCRAFIVSPTDHLPLELLLDAASTDVDSAIHLTLTAKGTPPSPLQMEVHMRAESEYTRSRAWQMVALTGSEHAI